MTKNILIVDDHPLIANGIKRLIEQNTAFEVVGIIYSQDDLWARLTRDIDILILDLNVKGKNSIEIISKIKSIQRTIKIVIFSSYNKPSLVRKAFKKGVDAYILKDSDENELTNALYQVLNEKQFIGLRVAIPKTGIPKKSKDFEDVFIKKSSLSKREIEVMNLVIEGFDNQKIAKKLFISKHTVQSHRKNIFKKMDVHSVAELIKLLHNL
ncbi:MAG: LuxR C-terminal-related transcriptional regulator [Saprospiraceae bacterium]